MAGRRTERMDGQCKEKVQSARTEWMKNNPETVKNNTEMKFSD